MAVYNLSFLNNVTSPIDIFVGMGSAVSSTNEYLIGYLILLSFFVIFLVINLRYDFAEILIIDGFITTILAGLLYFAGMVNAVAMIYPFVVTIIAVIFFFISKK